MYDKNNFLIPPETSGQPAGAPVYRPTTYQAPYQQGLISRSLDQFGKVIEGGSDLIAGGLDVGSQRFARGAGIIGNQLFGYQPGTGAAIESNVPQFADTMGGKAFNQLYGQQPQQSQPQGPSYQVTSGAMQGPVQPGSLAYATQQANTGSAPQAETLGSLVNPTGALFDRNTGLPITQQTPTTPAPNSMASAMAPSVTQTPDQIEEARRQALLGEQGWQASQAVYDPQQAYRDQLTNYQAQIDAQNAYYNDMLNQSRIQNAPGYTRSEAQTAAMAVNQGLTGSNVGEGMVRTTEAANRQEQASAEALINAQRQDALNRIYGKVTDSVTEAKKAFDEAKSKGGAAYIEAIKGRNETRKARLSSTVKDIIGSGFDLSTLSPEELKKLADEIGVSTSDLSAEYTTQFSESSAKALKAEAEATKAAADLEKTKADTAKILQDTANWGKATDYQKAQLAQQGIQDERTYQLAKEKAGTTNESLTGPALSQKVYQAMAEPSWNTPKEGQSKKELKEAQKTYIMMLGANPADYGL